MRRRLKLRARTITYFHAYRPHLRCHERKREQLKEQKKQQL